MKIFKLLLAIACSLNTIQASNVPDLNGDSLENGDKQPLNVVPSPEPDYIPLDDNELVVEEPEPELPSRRGPEKEVPKPKLTGATKSILKNSSKTGNGAKPKPRRTVHFQEGLPDGRERPSKHQRKIAINNWLRAHSERNPQHSIGSAVIATPMIVEENEQYLETAQIFLETYFGFQPNLTMMKRMASQDTNVMNLFRKIALQELSETSPSAAFCDLFRTIYQTFEPVEQQTVENFIWFVAQAYGSRATYEQLKSFISILPPKLVASRPMEIVFYLKQHDDSLIQFLDTLDKNSSARRLITVAISQAHLGFVYDAEMEIMKGDNLKQMIIGHLDSFGKSDVNIEERLEVELAKLLILQIEEARLLMNDLYNYLVPNDFPSISAGELRFISEHRIKGQLELLKQAASKVLKEVTIPDTLVLDESAVTLKHAIGCLFRVITVRLSAD